MEPIQNVLHPTDFSPDSAAALQVARALARDLGARLVILAVVPGDIVGDAAIMIPFDPKAYWQELEKLRSATDGPDLKQPVQVRVRQGDAASEILHEALESESDLIVMGSHGRSGAGRLLMGSVAEEVMRRARCPVLIVKRPHTAAA